MSMIEYDDISNKAIAAHLSRQDVKLAELVAMWQDSIADRKDIHARINDLVTERTRLIRESVVYQDAIEARLVAVEARSELASIQDSLDRLLAASTLSLKVHDWVTKNRIRSRTLALCALGGVPVLSLILNITAHHLGLI